MRIVLSQSAKFNPYSFERLLQPYAMYTQEYNDIEEGITELKSKAELMKQYALQEPDSKAANMYNAYANELDAQANELAKNGLKAVNRSNLLNLKSQYNSSIAPIEVAITRRRELADEQRKALSSDPTMMYDKNFNTVSLDKLIENPELSYNQYSGALLTKQVYDAVEGIKNSLSSYEKGNPIDSYTNTFIESYGFKLEEVLEAINNPNSASAPKVLTAIVDSVVQGSPISKWENRDDLLPDAYRYAQQSLWNAVGKSSVSPMENYHARLNAQAQKEKDVYDYKKKRDVLDTEDIQDPTNPQRHYRTIATTTVDDTKNTTKMKSDADFLREIAENPDLLNVVEQRYIAGGSSITGATIGGSYEEYEPNYERLQNIISRYGLNVDDEEFNYNSAADSIESEIKKSALRQNSYIMDITDGELMADTIRQNSQAKASNNGGTGVYVYENGKKKKEASVEDVTNYIRNNAFIEYNPKVGLIIHGEKDGTPKSFVLDPEIVIGESVEVGGERYNKYGYIIDNINLGIENGNPYITEVGIDMLMNNLYYQFNTKSKTQGKTLTAKESEDI